MTTAFAQIVLAVGVVALLAERVPSWMGSDDRAHQLEEELAARQSTQEQIDRVHQQLAQLMEAQTATVAVSQCEQDRIAQLNNLVDTVTHAQQKLNTQVAGGAGGSPCRSRPTSHRKFRTACVSRSDAVEADRELVRQDLQIDQIGQ